MVVAVDVAENLDRRLEVGLEKDRLGGQDLLNFTDQIQNLLLFNRESLKLAFRGLTFFGLQKVFDEN